MRLKQVGIYMICNKISGKFYIGRTQDFHKRIITHKTELKRKVHHSHILQKAYNKYGLNNLEFILFEECIIENCKEKEQFWIDTLKPVYNVSPNSNEGRYGRNSEKTIERSREAKRKWDIYQFDLKGNFIQKFRSGMDAARAVKASDSDHIHDVCKGKRPTAYKYLWSYSKIPKIVGKTRNRVILQYDLNNNFIREWNSIIEISRFYNVGKTLVGMYINKKILKTKKIIKNFIWKHSFEITK